MTFSSAERVSTTAIIRRAAQLQRKIGELCIDNFSTDGEQEEIFNIMRISADIESYLYNKRYQGNLNALSKFEADVMRPLAMRLRRYYLRNHLVCCTPFWTSTKVASPNGNEFAVFGDAAFSLEVALLVEPLGLSPITQQIVGTPDQKRWNAITGSNFCLFDFRIGTYRAGLWASMGHALGLALSVGTLPVILTDGEVQLPFDIHIDPIHVPSNKDAPRIIFESVASAAIAQFSVKMQNSSIVQTIDYVLDQVDDPPTAPRSLRQSVKALKNAQRPDPIHARLYLKSLLDWVGSDGQELLTPFWPGDYPSFDSPQCFHVLPFALPGEISWVVKDACGHRIVYQRGDTTGNIDIIEGIWHGISQASHVVVDITPTNSDGRPNADALPSPNVFIELGMAQALGRKLLLVQDERSKGAEVFPEISKLQICSYDSATTLKQYVEGFVRE